MKILFLTHRLPYAPNRGDRIRAFHIVRTLEGRGHDVQIASFVDTRGEAEQAKRMQRPGVDVTTIARSRYRNVMQAALQMGSRRPLTHLLLDAPEATQVLERMIAQTRPDVVLAFCTGMARFALQPPLDSIPSVLDMVDVDSVKWRELAGRVGIPKRWIYAREARCLASFEERAVRSVRTTVVINERERQLLAEQMPAASIRVAPNGVDVEYFTRPPAQEPSRALVFCGVMNYGPNAEAARWLVREVWPLIRRQMVDAELLIVGMNPLRSVQALHAPDQGVQVIGEVPDVRPYLWRADAAVAPLLMARGLQNKVLEAVAAGAPCVVTPAVAEGLPTNVLAACPVGGDATAFAEAAVRLLQMSAEARAGLVTNARVGTLSWSEQLTPLVQALEEVQ